MSENKYFGGAGRRAPENKIFGRFRPASRSRWERFEKCRPGPVSRSRSKMSEIYDRPRISAALGKFRPASRSRSKISEMDARPGSTFRRISTCFWKQRDRFEKSRPGPASRSRLKFSEIDATPRFSSAWAISTPQMSFIRN